MEPSYVNLEIERHADLLRSGDKQAALIAASNIVAALVVADIIKPPAKTFESVSKECVSAIQKLMPSLQKIIKD